MTDEIPFLIAHSRRKTMAIQVTRDGRAAVRCPMRVSDGAAKAFAKSHERWIEKHYQEARGRLECQVSYPPWQVKEYQRQAVKALTERTTHWAKRMGMIHGRTTIRGQMTRQGSCNAKGNLNYNWKPILVPEKLPDYVVVHELAHHREMNHSNRFWEIMKKESPDYKQRRRALKGYEDKISSWCEDKDEADCVGSGQHCEAGGSRRGVGIYG